MVKPLLLARMKKRRSLAGQRVNAVNGGRLEQITTAARPTQIAHSVLAAEESRIDVFSLKRAGGYETR
jgi:hypothetical protein